MSGLLVPLQLAAIGFTQAAFFDLRRQKNQFYLPHL
jgi:hypothetical protein